MVSIFISHSSKNNLQTLAIVKWLEENGIKDIFLDFHNQKGINPGDYWERIIHIRSHTCVAVFVLISPDWASAPWCLAEFALAKMLGKKIFGIIIEHTDIKSLPSTIHVLHLCDLIPCNDNVEIIVNEPKSLITSVSFCKDGLNRLKSALHSSGIVGNKFDWCLNLETIRPPYCGLKALEREDAAIYFGRDDAIKRAIDKIQSMKSDPHEDVFVIFGSSGSGKSSFLRAGLLPRLSRSPDFFILPIVRPQRNTISGPTGLIKSLHFTFTELHENVTMDDIKNLLCHPNGLHLILSGINGIILKNSNHSKVVTFILSIDQTEELLGPDGGEEATKFLNILNETILRNNKQLSGDGKGRLNLIVLLTIRAESYATFQSRPEMNNIHQHIFNLAPIPRGEYKDIIEGPARQHTEAGHPLEIEAGLTRKLIEDSEGNDALPLIALTLERLWTMYGSTEVLTLSHYTDFGGVARSIEKAIETSLEHPDKPPKISSIRADQEFHLRSGFIPRLVRIDPSTSERKRRVALWEEILRWTPLQGQFFRRIKRHFPPNFVFCSTNLDMPSKMAKLVVPNETEVGSAEEQPAKG